MLLHSNHPLGLAVAVLDAAGQTQRGLITLDTTTAQAVAYQPDPEHPYLVHLLDGQAQTSYRDLTGGSVVVRATGEIFCTLPGEPSSQACAELLATL